MIDIKTPEEILKQTIPSLEYTIQFNNKSEVIKAMQTYANQQVKEAVEVAISEIAKQSIEMRYEVSDKKDIDKYGFYQRRWQVCYGVSKQSILSLKQQILDKLNVK